RQAAALAAAQGDLEERRAEAEQLAAAGKYAEAIAAVQPATSSEFKDVASSAQSLVASLRVRQEEAAAASRTAEQQRAREAALAQARQDLERARGEAEKLAGASKWDEALARLKPLQGSEHAEIANAASELAQG